MDVDQIELNWIEMDLANKIELTMFALRPGEPGGATCFLLK